MVTEKDIKKYKREMERAKEQKANWEGQLESNRRRLKEEFGVENEQEAEKKLKQLQEDVDALGEEIEELGQELEEILYDEESEG